MNKTIFKMVLTTIIILGTIFYLISRKGADVTIKLENLEEEMSSNVGESLVIDGDTLTIVNYSIVSNSYTLSNGVEIDKSFLEN